MRLPSRGDLRRGLLRSLALALPLALFLGHELGPTWPSLLPAAFVGLIGFTVSLIESRAVQGPVTRRTVVSTATLVWAVAFAGVLLAHVQYAYTVAAVAHGTPRAGLEATGQALAAAKVIPLAVVASYLGACFTMAVVVRAFYHRGLGTEESCAAHMLAFVTLPGWILLALAWGIADAVERKLWPSPPAPKARAESSNAGDAEPR